MDHPFNQIIFFFFFFFSYTHGFEIDEESRDVGWSGVAVGGEAVVAWRGGPLVLGALDLEAAGIEEKTGGGGRWQ